MELKFIFKKVLILLVFLSMFATPSLAATSQADLYGEQAQINSPRTNLIKERSKKEQAILPNNFAITLYRPNYVLPYYYTVSPDNFIYQNSTPNNEQLKQPEFKFQLSFKVPVWKNIVNNGPSLYLAYTQLSYWQVYNHTDFFRETDYEPEIFLSQPLNLHLGEYWHIDFLNLGASHQSNGFGTSLERTWNRIYIEAISSSDHWMISLKPWYIFTNASGYQHYNPDMQAFLGYGRLLIAYKNNHNHVFSLSAHNFIEGHARSATGEAVWSFPLTSYLRGYVQLFSGYGQSLIEYNHRTNSAGIGISLNDWI